MIDNTINDDKTLAGGGKDVTPAGRDHALCRMGGVGTVWLMEVQIMKKATN